jgi:hypothetical protein
MKTPADGRDAPRRSVFAVVMGTFQEALGQPAGVGDDERERSQGLTIGHICVRRAAHI